MAKPLKNTKDLKNKDKMVTLTVGIPAEVHRKLLGAYYKEQSEACAKNQATVGLGRWLSKRLLKIL